MPYQNNLCVGICTMMKLPANIIDTRSEYTFLFQGYMQRFFGCIRKERVFFNLFFKYSSLE